MRGRHAGDDPERDEQAVLGAEHELADAREPPDPGGLTEGMLLDVPPGQRFRYRSAEVALLGPWRSFRIVSDVS